MVEKTSDETNVIAMPIEDDLRSIVTNLSKLGRLTQDFDLSSVIPLLKHSNPNIRLLAIKTIGKANNPDNTTLLYEHYLSEDNSMNKRETISAIGRMRSKSNIDLLINCLKEEDPKVLCQVIRSLLVFKGVDVVDEKLKEISEHRNEMVRSVILKEYYDVCTNKDKDFKAQHYASDRLRNVVVHGDTIEVMKLIPDNTIHLTFTSPPYYNARDYSIYQSYEDYLDFLQRTFMEVHRLTQEGRFLVVNTSPIIIPRISRQHASIRYPIPFDLHSKLVEIGWEFIDDIIWVKPEASVKDRNSGFRQHRKPLAYKPNPVSEYVMVYRKKTHKLIDWNIRQYDNKIVNDSRILGDVDRSNIWYIDPVYDKKHSAVFPVELCLKVVKYFSFISDIVFDPFAGSGTLGKAAMMLKRHFFLTEISKAYFDYIESNLNVNDLFYDVIPKFLTLNEFKENLHDTIRHSNKSNN